MKKILSIIMSVLLLISINTIGFAAGTDLEDIQEFSQEVSASLLQDFVLSYNDSDYGGAYIGDKGQLVINLINNKDNERQQSFINENNIKMQRARFKTDDITRIDVNYVDYSMQYLKDVIDKLFPHMVEFGIISMGIDEMNNCIVIDVKPTAQMEKINEVIAGTDTFALSDNKQIDTNLLKINVDDYVIEETATVQPGSRVTSTGGFTVAWGAIIEHSGALKGKKVFLVPGHAVSLNDTVKIGNEVLGKVIEQRLGGEYDFAYVENSGNTITNKLPNGEILPYGSPYYNPPQNLSVTAYGSVSGKQTGKILLTNFSFVSSNNISYKGMLKTSYKAIKGDSGAPVWSGSPIGMQSHTHFVNDEWVPGESYSMCTVMFTLCQRYSQYDISLMTF